MKHLFPSLQPLGLLSPFNPRNPLNPLRPFLIQRRPPGQLPSSHSCLLAHFYGSKVSLDSVPYPNQEWTRCFLDLNANDGRSLRGLVEVRVLSVPSYGWLAVGNLALWDFTTQDYFQIQRVGELDLGSSHRFAAPGWWLERKSGLFNVFIDEPNSRVKLNLAIHLGPDVLLRDPEMTPGFHNLNPRGALPVWLSQRNQFGRVTMNDKLEWGEQRIGMMEQDAGRAQLTHGSLHLSARDWRCFSPLALAEAAILRPRWQLYEARLDVPVVDGRHTLNFSLLDVENGHTGATMCQLAQLCDDAGRAARVELTTAVASQKSRVFGRLQVAEETNLSFHLSHEAAQQLSHSSAQVLSGTYTLRLKCDLDLEGATHPPPAGPLRYEVRRTPCGVSGFFRRAAGYGRPAPPVFGSGNVEVFDLLVGLGLK